MVAPGAGSPKRSCGLWSMDKHLLLKIVRSMISNKVLVTCAGIDESPFWLVDLKFIDRLLNSSLRSNFVAKVCEIYTIYSIPFYSIYMLYRRFVFSAISSSHASSTSNLSERGLRNSAESKGLRMKTMSSEGTHASWTWRCGRRWSLCWSSDVECCTM